uniref:Nardilysin convertase n=1 Tax=Haplochromis burtoni TaxID=8153 RepID=A0A3Q2WKC3_HAPBU
MPQTSKSSGAGAASPASAPDQGEPPPPEGARAQVAAGDGEEGATVDDQGDPEIVKSPSDPKRYRYIELSNGLRALLISDFSGADGEGGDGESAEQEEEQEEEEGGEEDEGDSGEGSEEEEGDRAEEEQDSDFEELEEENPVKKKKSSEKQAAAALCIGVGSFSDPDELPGLAHFLEHMVFMGSEKYPAENGFDAFLKKHGGSDNASTDCERTIFQFDVQRKHFRDALDRWAQFFICPLMIEDAVDREVEAVDSEFQLARPSDSHRKEMLFGSLAKPGHPMSKFCWVLITWISNGNYVNVPVFVSSGEPRPDFSHLQQPFDTPAFNKLYRVVPVRKVHALTISWAVPPQGKHYRVKPLHYISWLIGHEGTGSILSLLRKKNPLFLLSLFFRIYEEIQKIEANEFHYQEQTDPIEFVENICENMQLFPKQDFLTGDQLMFEYDPQVINAALSLLKPDRANLLLLSPENEGCCHLKEKWFGTCYSVEDIPEEWAERWAGDFELNPELHLPAENKFIATDFTLKTSDCPDTEYPVRIVNSERGCLWYKKDNKFKIPKAYIRFHLISPMIQKSPENLVLFDLFVNILAHNLAEPAYEADVAQLEYKLVAGEHGLMIRLKGFNHKLPLLLHLIVDQLSDFSTEPSVFTMFSEQLKKTYFNILIKPDRLGKYVHTGLLSSVSRGARVEEYLVQVKGLRSLMMSFPPTGVQRVSLSALMSHQPVCRKLQFQPLPADVPVLFRVVELPLKHHLCKVKSLNKGDANSEVTVYYQSGLKKLREHFVEAKIEEFLVSFGECLSGLSDEAFGTQVTALIKLKECEDAHLGEEVDRNWFEVVTQQYVFDRLNKEIEVLKTFTQQELVSWFLEHRNNSSRKLSVHVVGFGVEEGDQSTACSPDSATSSSAYGEVSELTFVPISSPSLQDTTLITDIRAFTSSLPLNPYHKIIN